MSGASARYFCLRTPVETSTPPYIKVGCSFCSFVRAEPFKVPRGVLIGW